MEPLHVYRIAASGVPVGVVLAINRQVAQAYALGKYGAGADAREVDYKAALDAIGICVLAETRSVTNSGSKPIRQLV